MLVGISCNDPDGGSAVDLAAVEATIDLDFGEAITCTFSNLDPEFVFVSGFEAGGVMVSSDSGQ